MRSFDPEGVRAHMEAGVCLAAGEEGALLGRPTTGERGSLEAECGRPTMMTAFLRDSHEEGTHASDRGWRLFRLFFLPLNECPRRDRLYSMTT